MLCPLTPTGGERLLHVCMGGVLLLSDTRLGRLRCRRQNHFSQRLLRDSFANRTPRVILKCLP